MGAITLFLSRRRHPLKTDNYNPGDNYCGDQQSILECDFLLAALREERSFRVLALACVLPNTDPERYYTTAGCAFPGIVL